jgi:hypothetical protein
MRRGEEGGRTGHPLASAYNENINRAEKRRKATHQHPVHLSRSLNAIVIICWLEFDGTRSSDVVAERTTANALNALLNTLKKYAHQLAFHPVPFICYHYIYPSILHLYRTLYIVDTRETPMR